MPEVPAGDREIGISVYLTTGAGIGGRLKSTPEDFIVNEIPLLPASDPEGNYLICSVSSRNWETNHLVRELSRQLGISRKRIGFAGTKDKRGITTQFMSFDGVEDSALDSVTLKDVEIRRVQRARRALSLGDLWGNEFSVTVRECTYSDGELLSKAEGIVAELESYGGFPNFFGIQRFGSFRPNTHLIGEAIVRGDFERAVRLYAGSPGQDEQGQSREARRLFDEGADTTLVLRAMPASMSFEKTLLLHLSKNPGDYVGALRRLPSNLLMMFVHAFQAWMFNEMLSMRIARGLPINRALEGDIVLPKNEKGLPDRGRTMDVNTANIDEVNLQLSRRNGFVSALLFGHSTPFASGVEGEIERLVVESHMLSPENFVVPEIRECTSAGSRREVLSHIYGIGLEVEGDTLRLKFRLMKGSYATVLLRELTKS